MKVKLDLMTKAANLRFEQDVEEWLRMGDDVRPTYVVMLLGLLEPETWISITDDKVTIAYHLSGLVPDFNKVIKDRNTTKVVVNRKGKNKLTLVRKNSRYYVTSI